MYAIDFHVHVFPDKLAERAVTTLSAAAGIETHGSGTIANCLAQMDRTNIRRSVLVSIATKPAQTKTINDWLWSQRTDRLIPFAAVHPEDPERFEVLKNAARTGFKGVKLHPNYQDFMPDEERVIELARAVRDNGLIMILHGGADDAFDEVPGEPARIARMMEAVPDLTLVIAHFGGYQRWDDVERLLVGSPAYFDISFTLPYMPLEEFVRIARNHGIDKLVFATDYPWADAQTQIDLLAKTSLAEEERAAILHGNAEKLLGIESL